MAEGNNIVDKPVEHYCRTAEEYYRNLAERDALLHKPFSSLIEATHSLAKLGPLLEGLRIGKKVTVLEFGAGTCWLSRFLALLGCRPICLDVSATALQLGERLFREWPSLYKPLEEPRFLLFDGRHIDLPDNSVDRVVCFEALHHVPNVREVLAEIYRVLAPGGIAGFAEPGEHHSEHPSSQAEILNYDVLELDIVIADIWDMARQAGFSDIRFRVFMYPSLDMSFQERNSIVSGEIPQNVSRHITESMDQWSIFFLHKGEPVPDSRGITGLRGEIEIVEAPKAVPRGERWEVSLRCSNTGEAVWLGEEAYKKIGWVRIGGHLYDGNMRLIDFEAVRHPLPPGMRKGESCNATVSLGPLAPGDYVFIFDLVAEHITWFETLGARPPRVAITVV